MLVRATTTTNAHNRRQRLIVPSTNKSNEIDTDYLQALKVIDQTRRQQDATSLLTKQKLRRSDTNKNKRSKVATHQFSSTLTPIGQEAMIKTYEDTLLTHIENVYSSKRISAILPRLSTATFRDRLPMIKNSPQTHLDNIQHAQYLIDNILNNNSQKEEILYDYVQWQQKWTKDF